MPSGSVVSSELRIDEATCLAWHGATFVPTLARFEGDRAPHALLVTGPAGIGKYTFAAALARHVLGRGRTLPEDLEAVPDFRRIVPEEPGKPIVVDQIRALIDFVALTSAGGHKFALVDPADALNTSAANGLLKTLEEPPPRSTIVLISARPSALLPTIRSRCQRIVLGTPAPDTAAAWLDQTGAAAPDIARALALSRGSPGRAAALIDADVAERIGAITSALNRLLRGRDGVLATAAGIGDRDPEFVPELAALALEALLRRTVSSEESDTPESKLTSELTEGVDHIHLQQAFAAYDRVLAARDLVARGSPVRALDIVEDVCEALARVTRPRAG